MHVRRRDQVLRAAAADRLRGEFDDDDILVCKAPQRPSSLDDPRQADELGRYLRAMFRRDVSRESRREG